MDLWKSILKADPTEWLLEEENPSVRYFALIDLLDVPGDDPEACRAKKEIMEKGLVPEILSRQREESYLRTCPRFYTNKYEGLVWQLILLAELGSGAVPQIREQCEYILRNSQEPKDGGFSMHASARSGGGLSSEVIACLTGNMAWCLLRFGYGDDPRLRKGLGWITRFMRFDDGDGSPPNVPPYDRFKECWGGHTCHMGVVKALKALSAVPEGERTREIADTIQKAVEFLLIHHIYKRSRALNKVSKPGWLRFGFPLMYQTDALEILDILTGLGIRDDRMDDALRIVREKQNATGKWLLENSYCADRMLLPFGKKGEADKWVTLRAMRVLKRAYSG